MFRRGNTLQSKALITLLIGALGDWTSTRIGLSLGLAEGNRLATYLMSRGAWIQVDFILIGVCFMVPFLVNNFTDERAPKNLFFFPIVAGILKLMVSLLNISTILV